ncbi:tetraspanin 35 [Gadus morhua]|uniref:Tetraspanin n=1 Tax=Gadus morhua TaxID=8049 RepID=A0A8C4YXQ3_GADMO|nr:tetraspanin-1-like [Gadus morhua]XP_030201685.1 tetraspanin-1-like [Gadus morhua]XP_030201692.1 tetraspanin-1-like [Gadus morhua]
MGCFGFLKFMMFIFNGLIFLAGAALLGVGIWVKVDSRSIMGLLNSMEGAPEELGQLLNVGYLLIAIGVVLVVIGFLGCCGAIKESRCMLMLFFIIILVIFLAEVAGAVVILVFKPAAKELIGKVGDAAKKSIVKDYGSDHDVTQLWNSTMDALKCCGFYNYTDFTNSTYFTDNKVYPSQCCQQRLLCTEAEASNNATSITGCFPKIVQLIEDNSVAIIGVALGIAALELLAMIVAMTLYCKIGSKNG